MFDAIVRTASRLFARTSRIRVVDGEVLRLCASSDRPGTADLREDALPANRDSVGGRVWLERRALQVGDTTAQDAPPSARRRQFLSRSTSDTRSC